MLTKNLKLSTKFNLENFSQIIEDVQNEGTILRLGYQTIIDENEKIISQKPIYFMPGFVYTDDGNIMLDGFDYPKSCCVDLGYNNLHKIMQFLNRLCWGDVNGYDKYVKTIIVPEPLVIDEMFYHGKKVILHIVEIESLRIGRIWHYGIKPSCENSDYPIIFPLPRNLKENIILYGRWYRSSLKYMMQTLIGHAQYYQNELNKISDDYLSSKGVLSRKYKKTLRFEGNSASQLEEFKKAKLFYAIEESEKLLPTKIKADLGFVYFKKPKKCIKMKKIK